MITEAGNDAKVAGLVYIAAFAPDKGESVATLNEEEAAFMAVSRVPWELEARNGTVGAPAWRAKPSWYLVATDDRTIPPAAQRSMAKRAGSTVVEASGSHVIYASQPLIVAALIEKAASELKEATLPSRC